MEICSFCNSEFLSKRALSVHQKRWCKKYIEPIIDTSNYSHVCVCGKKFKSKSSKHGHAASCERIRDRREAEELKLTYALLYELFVIKNYSASEIHRFLKLQYVSIGRLIFIAKQLNIKTKTVKDALNLKTVRAKCESECIKKYGDINVLGKKSPKYAERNATVFAKYGVKNVFQLNSVKEKSSKTLFHNHGVYRAVDIANRYKNNGRKSKPHKKVEELLHELGIEFESERVQHFHKNNYNPRPDIIILNKKIIIEIYGNYWHANPALYKPSDLVVKWNGTFTAEHIWKSDKLRIDQMKSFGYNVIILWESDIVNLTSSDLWKILESNQYNN